MPYVPPHVRAAQAAGTRVALVVAESPCNQDYANRYGISGGSRVPGSSYGSYRRGAEGQNGPTSNNVGQRAVSLPDVIWAKWLPSERILRLQQDQITEVRCRLNIDVEIPPGSMVAPTPIESFEDMCLESCIMKDITFHEYTTPTPIQSQAIPVALCGRDLLGCAETGSGKTAAFALPMIQHCLAQPPLRHGDGPLALVLAPTRELAQQIEREVKAFSRSAENFRTAIVVGGVNIGEQRAELRSGVQVVVATPGRLIDHLQQGNSSLARVSYIVLDEADRMLDMGFEPQIREVMRSLPRKHQTLLFSATMPEEIESLAQEYLNAPVRVKVGRVSSPTANVRQTLEKVADNEKGAKYRVHVSGYRFDVSYSPLLSPEFIMYPEIDMLLALLVEEASHAERTGKSVPLTIVFVERKARCDEVTNVLIEQGLKAAALHGGRSQLDREGALQDFRKGSINILVATDVASRGLDVSGVSHVVNLDLPKTMEDYVHRIGRTGRAGAMGRATSFFADHDAFLVAQIRRAITEAEAGNMMAFATGKAARRKEREQAAAFREGRLAPAVVGQVGATTVRVDDRYKHMLVPSLDRSRGEGAADDAWDD